MSDHARWSTAPVDQITLQAPGTVSATAHNPDFNREGSVHAILAKDNAGFAAHPTFEQLSPRVPTIEAILKIQLLDISY